MRVYPSNTNAVDAPCQPAPRQGEIASLDAELAAAVQENASCITRLYDLAQRLGLSVPTGATEAATPPQPIGQLGELRDSVGRLRRENSILIHVLEALENL